MVPRASTHLEYTDIAYVLPASRYGQALTSVVRAEVARSLPQAPPHDGCWQRASATSSRWTWAAGTQIELDRSERLSFYFCSGYSLGGRVSTDIAGVGGC